VGHFAFGIHRFLKRRINFCYLTLLRHPRDRIISLYRHLLYFDVPNPELHQTLVKNEIGLHEFASTFALPELANDQTRRVAGIAGPCTRRDLEQAKRRLTDDFAFVGLTERFDESVVLLKRQLGWAQPLQYYPANVSRDFEMPIQEPSAEALAAIDARNSLDLELYQSAKDAFELRLASEAANGLAEEVANFREHNRRMIAKWRKSNVDS